MGTLATAIILAEDFRALGTLFLVTALGLPALAGLSLLSSRRGRFPWLAIPAMLLCLPMLFGCLIAHEAAAFGWAVLFSIPLFVGGFSIYLCGPNAARRDPRRAAPGGVKIATTQNSPT